MIDFEYHPFPLLLNWDNYGFLQLFFICGEKIHETT